jgi:hypothetical protein
MNLQAHAYGHQQNVMTEVNENELHNCKIRHVGCE